MLVTPRLVVRAPEEEDRRRFVELFGDDDFMVFSPRPLGEAEANGRFDHFVELSERVPFSKRPVVERASGEVVGYTGVDRFEFEGRERLEWGFRLIPRCRGLGYATEATLALLGVARETFSGELLAIVDPRNEPSANVCHKVGFAYWKRAPVDGELRDLYTFAIGS